ncbi:CDP-glycerol glycerophosphotransferase family protein, partial [Escherichia coli]
MNIKKLNKLKKDPKLFFYDMVKKKTLNIKNRKRLENYYNIVIFTNGIKDNSCYKYPVEKNIAKKNNINIIFVNLSDAQDLRRMPQLIKHDYTLFLWQDDHIASDFLYRVDRILKNNNELNTILIPDSRVSEKNFLKGNPDAVSSYYQRKKYEKLLSKQIIASSIYGMVFPSRLIRKVFNYQREIVQNKINFVFNGFLFLLEIITQNESKYTLLFDKNLTYMHERSSLSPFKGQSWYEQDIFCDDFTFLVRKVEQILDRDISQDVKTAARRSFFQLLLQYIKSGLTNHSLLDIINKEDESNFKDTFVFALRLVGDDCISSFDVGCAESIKIGCLKILGVDRQSKYIDLLQLDKSKNDILFRYYSSYNTPIEVSIGHQELIPIYFKNICHKLFSDVFFYEQRIWVQIGREDYDKQIKIKLLDKFKTIRDFNRKEISTLTYKLIQQQYDNRYPCFHVINSYAGCWLLMDRDNQADDNAEHLYRYIAKHRPDILMFFVLLRDSHDWDRLEKDGFNLLAFGSKEHEYALESCDKIISSHAAQFVTDYFKDKRMLWKKFIFLQHGIIHNDQSALFKPDWKKIDLFLTSGIDEYVSITEENSSYKFTEKEVLLTGLPRHDALLTKNIEEENLILVMPTWRPSLLGKVLSGTRRELINNFQDSEYARAWRELLSSNELYTLIQKEKYKIVFFPHANMQPYISEFNLPEYINIESHHGSNIQDLFKRAKIMITDYSSVAFEMAYLRKSVCYYQFDEQEFFTKGHYNKGYFDYRQSGFGPVFNTIDGVLSFLHDTIRGVYPNAELYKRRAFDFFPYRDGKCCERVLEAIIQLEQPRKKQPDISILKWADNAYKTGDYIHACYRYDLIKHNKNLLSGKSNSLFNYINSLIYLGKFDIASDLLNGSRGVYKQGYLITRMNMALSLVTLSPFKSEGHVDNRLLEQIQLYFNHEYIDTSSYVANDSLITNITQQLRSLEKSGKYNDILLIYKQLSNSEASNIINKSIYIRALYHLKKWQLLLDNINGNDIFTGRTGVDIYIAAYFFAIRSSKNKVSSLSDYIDSILDDKFDERYVNEVFSYLLYHDEYDVISLFYKKWNSKISQTLTIRYFKYLLKIEAYEEASNIVDGINIIGLDNNILLLITEFLII